MEKELESLRQRWQVILNKIWIPKADLIKMTEIAPATMRRFETGKTIHRRTLCKMRAFIERQETIIGIISIQ